MDTFYNSHLRSTVKEKILSTVSEEGSQWLGCGMTYTIFECLKERVDELTEEQPLETVKEADNDDDDCFRKDESRGDSKSSAAPKREQLTKAQKRKQWERTDHQGNRERGWNWIDLIKHLSQSGNKEESGKPPSM